MRILSRYVVSEFLQTFLLCEVAFFCIYLLIDFFERIGKLVRYGGSGGEIALYFIYKAPIIIYQMTPVAVLIGATLCLAAMNRRREIIAIEGSGIPLWWATSPIIAAAFVISTGAWALNEYLVPVADSQLEYLYNVKIKGYSPKSYHKLDHIWYRSENRLYYIRYFDPHLREMKRVTVFFLGDDGKPIRRVDAESASVQNGIWELTNGTERYFHEDGRVDCQDFNRKSWKLPETAADMLSIVKKPDEMNFRELKKYIHKLKKEGFDTTEYQVDLYAKISVPFISLIMGLIGIPLGLIAGPRAGPAVSLGLSIIFGMSCWFVLALSLSLGKSGALPPLLAAWTANIIYMVMALLYLFALRRRW